MPETVEPMNTDERNALITAKLNEGISLSEIQKELGRQGVNMTYLDLRLLADELKVNWKKQDPKDLPKSAPKPADLLDKGPKPGGTTVTVSKLVRPGAAMSGSVVFASGAKAEWVLGNDGRLGLIPAAGSSKPTEEDLIEFQAELQRKLGGG